jgi:hypothetical protein
MSPQEPPTIPRGFSQNGEVPSSTGIGNNTKAPAKPTTKLSSQGRAGTRLIALVMGMLAAPALLIADH